MRCPDCNKFVAYDDSNEPEINTEEIGANGGITFEGRVYLSCAECGQELKEFNFELTEEIDPEIVEAHSNDGHSLEIQIASSELTNRSEGKGRGMRTYYGVQIDGDVNCSCGESGLFGFSLSDECQASAMDELV